METEEGLGCVLQADVLLAEFRGWLDRERGLSPVSVRCYSKQAKYFLAAVGVPWSPKLVKVNAARPRGAVRNVPNSGSAPSCRAQYMYEVLGRRPPILA